MAAKCSTAPALIWNWIIEALANFEQVDTSTIIGLVKTAPAISDDLGKDAREMISLRILESLFVHGKESTVDTNTARNAKISFDPSESGEDVLQRILSEQTPEVMTELDKEKWDVGPFLMHKRSSVPKCRLEKLKEKILESSNPLLASLKEKSKLATANASEHIRPAVDGDFDAQTTVANDDLSSLNPGKDTNKWQENPLQEADQVGNFTGGTTEHTGNGESEMLIQRPLEVSNGNKPIDHDEHVALEKSCDIADNMPRDACREGKDKTVLIDDTIDIEFVSKFIDPKNNIQPNALDGGPSNEAKNSMEHDRQLGTSSDSERSDDMRTDIAAKKEAFLNSQCTLGLDSMAMADWTEINLCMKCNEGGQLLVCSSDACMLRVHESCLGSAAILDENAEFYCPFCAYSRAISKYMEAKRTAFLARKDLQAFSSFGVKCRPNEINKQRGLEKNEVRQTRALCVTNVTGEKEAAVTGEQNSLISEPSRLCVNNDESREDEVVSVANRGMAEAEEVGRKTENHQCSSQAGSDCGPKSPCFEGNESSLVVGEKANMHTQTGCLNQQTTDLPQNPTPPRSTPPRSTPKKKRKEREGHISIESSCSVRLRKRKLQYTPPAGPSLRRKKLPWTKSEEDILKEGMQRYSNANTKGIPWTEILDFGRNVFHKGRTPIDLKDKWRNLCKGSPNLK